MMNLMTTNIKAAFIRLRKLWIARKFLLALTLFYIVAWVGLTVRRSSRLRIRY
jgi:hypothetical protein